MGLETRDDWDPGARGEREVRQKPQASSSDLYGQQTPSCPAKCLSECPVLVCSLPDPWEFSLYLPGSSVTALHTIKSSSHQVLSVPIPDAVCGLNGAITLLSKPWFLTQQR